MKTKYEVYAGKPIANKPYDIKNTKEPIEPTHK